MGKSKKSTVNLSEREIFVACLNKFSQLISDHRNLSKQIEAQFESKSWKKRTVEQERLVDDALEKQHQIVNDLAIGGVAVYREAVRLQLPTRPDNVLHLATNCAKCGEETEVEDLFDRAEDEVLQLIIEAQAWTAKPYGKQTKQQRPGQGKPAIGGDKAGDRKRATPETTKPKVESIRDQVFICYSHKDDRWLGDLQTHLTPYVRNGSMTAWSDKQIAPGSKWFPEIKAALASTKVAVLLVTPSFLASDFIHEHELTPLLKDAEKGGVWIIWIPVRACSYEQTPLKDDQAAIDPKKPLANMKAERDKAWVEICKEIEKAVGR